MFNLFDQICYKLKEKVAEMLILELFIKILFELLNQNVHRKVII